MTTISFKPERIHIQNTTFQKEYGEIVDINDKFIIVKLFYKEDKAFEENTSFTRAFSKKTGKAVGSKLKILP